MRATPKADAPAGGLCPHDAAWNATDTPHRHMKRAQITATAIMPADYQVSLDGQGYVQPRTFPLLETY